MLRFLKSFFGKSTPPVEPEVPYKVEAPAPAPVKCGCGRSPSGFCVGLHKLTPEEWAAHPDNPVKPVAQTQPEKPPTVAKKKPAAKKAPAAKKPAAMTAAPKPKTRTKKPAK